MGATFNRKNDNSPTKGTFHWALSGAPSVVAIGTDSSGAAATPYVTSIVIPVACLLTGIAWLIGSVGGTDKAIVYIWDKDGNLIANSDPAGTTVGTAATGEFFEFGGWRFLFTGWKSSQMSIDLVHQWVAAPIKPFGPFMGKSHVFYVSMPGSWGLLGRGEHIDCSYRWNHVGYGADIAYGEKDRLDAGVLASSRAIFDCTINGACGFDRKESYPYWTATLLRDKASWQTMALLDPKVVLTEEYGVDNYEDDNCLDAAVDIRRRLYGAEV